MEEGQWSVTSWRVRQLMISSRSSLKMQRTSPYRSMDRTTLKTNSSLMRPEVQLGLGTTSIALNMLFSRPFQIGTPWGHSCLLLISLLNFVLMHLDKELILKLRGKILSMEDYMLRAAKSYSLMEYKIHGGGLLFSQLLLKTWSLGWSIVRIVLIVSISTHQTMMMMITWRRWEMSSIFTFLSGSMNTGDKWERRKVRPFWPENSDS